jgi:Type IV secretion system pilin
MKLLLSLLAFSLIFLGVSSPALAMSANDVANFSSQAIQFMVGISVIVSTLFVIRAGYMYISSTGNPEAVEKAKKALKNSLLGLVIVLSAAVISSFLISSFHNSSPSSLTTQIPMSDITTNKPQDGIAQAIIDAVTGFLREIITSATKPLVDGVINFLSTTPLVSQNGVIFNFWLVTLGIADSLFVLFVALLGFHVMGAETFGFDEVPLRNLLPRIGIAFLGANTSIFLIDAIIQSANAMVGTLISRTGGLDHAWVFNAVNLPGFITGQTPLITLIFWGIFEILIVLLILFYISRIIIIAVGTALAPFVFLIWSIPKLAPISEILAKTYLVAIYIVFVHVVIIQLASAVLADPSQSSNNSILSVLIGVGLLITLLKTPPLLMQVVFYSAGSSAFRTIGGQIVNVLSSSNKQTPTKEGTKGGTTGASRNRPVANNYSRG